MLTVAETNGENAGCAVEILCCRKELIEDIESGVLCAIGAVKIVSWLALQTGVKLEDKTIC